MADTIFITSLIAATLRLAVPVIISAEGEVITERAGVINVGIEGIALLGGFTSTYVAHITQNPWIALLAAMITGVLLGILHASISLHPKGDQFLVGIGMNTFALGFTAYGLIVIWGELSAGASPRVPKTPQIQLPFEGAFSELSIFVIFTILLAVAVNFILFKTTIGLRLRSVGENPAAADSAGINVYRTRLFAVVIGSALAALSGAYLTIDQHGRFQRYMTTGGFSALAIVVFGNWNPLIVLGGGLIFGFGEALVSRLAPALGVGLAPQFIQMVPLILTIVIYSLRKKVTQPEALGKPYIKE